jgi:GntR family transcriptional repressor for pyruvate dehydrogenase complex
MGTTATIEIGKRETVVDAIAQALIRYIAANGLKGGDQLPSERDLAEMVKVSRLPLREAVCILKGLGIVEAKQGKGVFVRRLDMSTVFGMLSPLLKSQADIRTSDIVEARLHIESSIAECAALHRTDEDLEELRDCLAGMRQDLPVREKFVIHDMKFHHRLARCTGNPIFHIVMSAITDLMHEVQIRFPDKVEYREGSIRIHEQILEAVAAADAPRARSAMIEHIRTTARRLAEEAHSAPDADSRGGARRKTEE